MTKFSIFKSTLIIAIAIQFYSCKNNMNSTMTQSIIDPRDSIEYKCRKIGGQVWMIENLAYKTKNDRSVFYADDSLKYHDYGRLYFAEDIEEAASFPGWHLPDTAEWFQLLKFYNLENGNFGARENHKKCAIWEIEHQKDIQAFLSDDKNGFNFQYGGLWHSKWMSPKTKRQKCFEHKNNSGYYWASPIGPNYQFTHIGLGVYKYQWMEITTKKPSSTYKSGEKFRFNIRLVKDD